MPRLQFQSLVGAHVEGNQLMFLSHVDVSLFSLSGINSYIKNILLLNTRQDLNPC